MDNKMGAIEVFSGASAKAGVGVAAATGVSVHWFGLSADQWTILIGVVGVLVGAIGVLINSRIRWLDYQDKARHRTADYHLKLSQVKQQK